MKRLASMFLLIPLSINRLASTPLAEESSPPRTAAQQLEEDTSWNEATRRDQVSSQFERVLQEAQSAYQLEKTGDLHNAEQMRQQAIKSLQALAKLDRLHFAVGAQSCARAFAIAGKHEEARTLLSEAWHRVERNPGHHAAVLRHRLLHTAGKINLVEEKYLDAKQHFDYAAKIASDVFGKDSEDYGNTLLLLGLAEMKLDEINEAQRHLMQAETILSTKLGDNAEETVTARVYMANLLCIQRNFDAAQTILLRAVEHLDKTSRGSQLYVNCRLLLAKVCVEKGELQEGEKILVEIINAVDAKDLQKGWIVAQGTLAKVYRLKGDFEQAQAALNAALNGAREHDPTGLDTAGLLHESALLSLAREDRTTAANDVEEAIRIASSKLKPTHRDIIELNETKAKIDAE